jgi:hypothetical protein
MKAVNGSRTAGRGMLLSAFFWGLLWGIWEATAGHVVHLLRVPGLAGIVMAPAALFFLVRGFSATGKYEAVFLTGCVAAGMKLLDLVIPGRDIMAVVNPAQFILLEALAVSGFYAFRISRQTALGRPIAGPARKNRG